MNDVTAPVAVFKLSREERPDRFIFDLYTGQTDNHPSNKQRVREESRILVQNVYSHFIKKIPTNNI